MIDLYPAYKPFRNYMTRCATWPSLVTLWGYYNYVVNSQALLPGLAVGRPPHVGLRNHLHPWDLEILVREIVLNSSSLGTKDLSSWNDLADAVNHIRRLESVPYAQKDSEPDVLLDLHRIAHRQFRWQSGLIDSATMIRLVKIFGGESLNENLLINTGLEIDQLLRLGAAVTGGLFKHWGVQTETDYTALGIDRSASSALLNRLTNDLVVLREKTRRTQRYDETWLYAWSPMEAQPLIRLPAGGAYDAICPIPQYLFSRLTTGVFYDIVNAPGFANPYGDGFQQYVGEVIAATVFDKNFSVLAEEPYAEVKARLKHGTDWVVSDASGHLFIECKTKRMSVGAKNATDPAAILIDVMAMAKSVAQTYKNIRDALKGLTRWSNDNQPIYPMIVTLEDWYLHSPRLIDPLNEQVRTLLVADEIDSNVLESMPYSIVSVAELERALQIIASQGIGRVMSAKVETPMTTWAMLTYLQQAFAVQLAGTATLLFPADAQRLFPEFPVS